MTTIHPVVRAYADRQGLGPDAFRPDGRLVLDFDERYRVQLRAASEGRVALSAQLADLARWPRGQVDEVLQRLAGKGLGLLRSHAAGIVIDEPFESLELQQVLPHAIGVDGLERELGDFVNVLAFWLRVCDEEVGRRIA